MIWNRVKDETGGQIIHVSLAFSQWTWWTHLWLSKSSLSLAIGEQIPHGAMRLQWKDVRQNLLESLTWAEGKEAGHGCQETGQFCEQSPLLSGGSAFPILITFNQLGLKILNGKFPNNSYVLNNFIATYCYNCSILINLLLWLVYKLNFIRSLHV